MSRGRVGTPWGHGWRSSDAFIVSTMGLALFTDELLFAFMIPLLPTVLEHRIGLDPSLTQRYTSIFLTEGAFVSMVSSPFIGSIADTTSSKKTLLLTLLVLALISIACLSLTTNLIWLFVGRFFQCIVSQGLWIVGMATMAENIGTEHMGKIAGLSSTLTAAGTTAGPLLAGLLFEAGGYWCAWAGAASFLLADIIMRLIMTEKSIKSVGEDRERETLVNEERSPSPELRGWHFYICLFRETPFLAGVFCSYAYAFLIGCFESTLAVHVRSVFGWRAFHVGLLLAAIQGPGLLLSAPIGWLKDRKGSRTLTAVAFFMLAPFVITLGVPGDSRFAWAPAWGKTLYGICVAAIGCLICLLSGVGSIEATETIDILASREPDRFGSGGGYSRALAVTCMTWMAGLMTGPLVAELMVETLGYFELQVLLGILCLVAGLIALLFLSPSPAHTVES